MLLRFTSTTNQLSAWSAGSKDSEPGTSSQSPRIAPVISAAKLFRLICQPTASRTKATFQKKTCGDEFDADFNCS
ncbi:hypothetical protein Y032_0515g2781 [Ancylostoma ceylanicum]|uniref:Uncharacterized protein n=1 Tax=Ancylostoma ceylanicum TaxID=53326 RepID=A0A016WT58_9BILA|nr:hypothetical protein Y032_0515g2781 [Ancylostoma ceylanicum]